MTVNIITYPVYSTCFDSHAMETPAMDLISLIVELVQLKLIMLSEKH